MFKFVELVKFVLALNLGKTPFSLLQAVDVGGSMFVHTFGAYFGLALSRVLHIGDIEESEKEGSAYHSDIFSMIGN